MSLYTDAPVITAATLQAMAARCAPDAETSGNGPGVCFREHVAYVVVSIGHGAGFGVGSGGESLERVVIEGAS